MSKSLKAVFVFCFVLVLCSGCPDRQVSEPVPAAPKLDKIVVPDDMPDLENAIARIAENGTIEIKPGKYLFKVPNRIGHNITITGTTDNPDDVVLECLNNSVFLIVADKAVIRNMTLHTIGIDSTVNLIAGASELSHCKISADKYASVFVTGASNATVSDCELTGSQNGVLVQTGSVTVRNCDISNMTEHGVAVTRAEGSVTVIDSKISNAKMGISITAGQGTIENTEVFSCVDIALSLLKESKVTFKGVKVHDCHIGSIVFDRSQGIFENCEYYSNLEYAFGLEGENSVAKVTGCRIHDEVLGVKVWNKASGTFEQNILSDNQQNWDIQETAGTVERNGNTPNE